MTKRPTVVGGGGGGREKRKKGKKTKQKTVFFNATSASSNVPAIRAKQKSPNHESKSDSLFVSHPSYYV